MSKKNKEKLAEVVAGTEGVTNAEVSKVSNVLDIVRNVVPGNYPLIKANKRAAIISLYVATCNKMGLPWADGQQDLGLQITAKLALHTPIGVFGARKSDSANRELKGEVQDKGMVGYARFVMGAYKGGTTNRVVDARKLLFGDRFTEVEKALPECEKVVAEFGGLYGIKKTEEVPV